MYVEPKGVHLMQALTAIFISRCHSIYDLNAKLSRVSEYFIA